MSQPIRPSPRTDAVVARGFAGLAVGTMVVTTWIGFRSWDAFWRALIHPLELQQPQALATGLWSSNLMILQVLLMARLPWLERAWGREVLTRRHRQLGYWSFWLMILHVLLFVLARSQHEPDAMRTAMARLFLTDPWMLVATIGTALIVLVVVTSMIDVRRWMPYETWHLIHLYAYLGMGLTLPHQLATGDFRVGWIATYWWVLYAGTLAVVLVWRVGVPVQRSLRHGIRIERVHRETPDAVSVTMTGRDLQGLGARSGQFFVWRFLGRRGWTRGHPYSISAAPTGERLRVTIADEGDEGARAGDLRVGARVLVEGPYGSLDLTRRRHPRFVMFAAGAGITPFRSLLEDADVAPGEAALVYRVRAAEHAMFRAELEELAAVRGFDLVLLAGPRRSAGSWLPEGVVGGEAAAMTRMVSDLGDRDVYLCGPPAWSAQVARTARQVGVSRRDLHREDFSW
ncbi:MAG: ferredoxin reductase family protein [Lapillicoccus sp.]